MKLIIVESPTKSRTLKQFLGKDFKISATLGHIRDLPKKTLGVDIEKDFTPKYVIMPGKNKTINELKKESKKAKEVFLAMDPDREGEAIAWHTKKALGLNEKSYKRIVFHEITKSAIERALENPRKIDMDLVDAQQTRRILDRIVGYKLSPFLWRKVMRGLSAGRVQSVATRLIAEREKEIKAFVTQEYWSIEALLQKILNPKHEIRNKSKIFTPHRNEVSGVGQNSKSQTDFKALLIKKNGKIIPKLGIKSKKEAEDILKDLKGAEYKVISVERKERKRSPLPPFTTSTLQQESWIRFRLPAETTMKVAQNLYEKGLITYHRSDSLNLSQQSLASAKEFILDNLGKDYWAGYFREYKTKAKGAQEAHEAIRPTAPGKTPENVASQENLDHLQSKIYDIIWRRFIACQMSQAIFDSTDVEIDATNPKHEARNPKQIQNSKFEIQNKYTFRATGQILKFDGFLKIYPMRFEEMELPVLEKNEILELIKLIPSQHFTQPPPRYTEASLIKTLEKYGIGRPSTYAPILSVIQKRNYVKKDEKKRFYPTEIGTIVNDLLVEHFQKIVDIQFTANMEEGLDEIAEGKKKWVPFLSEFYKPFEENLKEKYKKVEKQKPVEKTDKKCPKCGAPLLIRYGRFGKFYGCSKFPNCKHTAPLESGLGLECPQCKEGEITEKKTKKGKVFYGCNRWPKCDFALWDKPIGKECPKCGALLVEKNKKIICSNKYCDFVEKKSEK